MRSILISLPCCCCCCVVACARGRLTERDQKWDRTTAEEVLKLSMALGYKLRRTRMAGRHGPAAPEAEHVNAALAAGVVLAAPGPLALGGRVRGGRCRRCCSPSRGPWGWLEHLHMTGMGRLLRCCRFRR